MTTINRLSGIGDEGSGFDWNNLVNQVAEAAGKVLPTVFNHNATNPYATGLPYSGYPNSSYPNSSYPYTSYNQPSTGMNMTNILLLGGAALVAYKLLKKK